MNIWCSYCILQLVTVPDDNLHLYYKRGRVGDDPNAEERLETWENVDNAVKEFVRLFEEITGNEFESWEREKIFQKKLLKFCPVDMASESSVISETILCLIESIYDKMGSFE